MKVQFIPKSGKKDSVIYSSTPHGYVAREFVHPYDPRTAEQLSNRSNFAAIAGRWRSLTPEQRDAWRNAVRGRTILTRAGRRVRPNCYHYFISINTQRADLGLPQFDLPPEEPSFGPNPVAELVITDVAGAITLKLRVPSPPAQYTLLQGAAPVRSGVRSVQRFTFLGLLPPPVDGWSDITGLYVARYGPPKPGMAVWIRTCQHIDGCVDAPKVARARVRAREPKTWPEPPRDLAVTSPLPGMCVVNGKVVKFSMLGVGWVCGWEDRALQECNLSAQPSLECGCIRSRCCLAVAPGDGASGMPQQSRG